jgi:hypothetical protein
MKINTFEYFNVKINKKVKLNDEIYLLLDVKEVFVYINGNHELSHYELTLEKE